MLIKMFRHALTALHEVDGVLEVYNTLFFQVMRNMNRTWWGIPNYSVLEKVSHALHMAEAWENAMEEYKMIERLLDPESDICSCVTGTWTCTSYTAWGNIMSKIDCGHFRSDPFPRPKNHALQLKCFQYSQFTLFIPFLLR